MFFVRMTFARLSMQRFAEDWRPVDSLPAPSAEEPEEKVLCAKGTSRNLPRGTSRNLPPCDVIPAMAWPADRRLDSCRLES